MIESKTQVLKRDITLRMREPKCPLTSSLRGRSLQHPLATRAHNVPQRPRRYCTRPFTAAPSAGLAALLVKINVGARYKLGICDAEDAHNHPCGIHAEPRGFTCGQDDLEFHKASQTFHRIEVNARPAGNIETAMLSNPSDHPQGSR